MDNLYYKLALTFLSGETLLQSGVGIAKMGNHYYKVGQLRAITKWDKVITYYKSGLVIIKQGSILIKRSYRSRSEKDKS